MAFWNFNKNEQKNANIPMIESILIGNDLGYGQIKVLSKNKEIKFISAVGTPITQFGKASSIASLDELLNNLWIDFEGKAYYIGRNAIINTRNGRLSLKQDKANTIENKVKFITSLALLMDEDQNYAEFDIVTGLPVLEYKNQKDDLVQMMSNGGKIFTFTMNYGPKAVEKKIKVNSVRVISQGEGAFYDFILDKNGDIIEKNASIVEGMVMVVDIGYRTTDIVTMENGSYIETLSDQINKGVNTIHQEILKLMMDRLNIKKELKDMDKIVRTGNVYHNTQNINVSKIINDVAQPFAEDVVENLNIISNDQLGSISHIILTGGGAEILFPFIQKSLNGIVNISLMENSEFCNASGYYKYGLLLKKATENA